MRLPPPETAPTDSITSPETLLRRRPLCALTLYGARHAAETSADFPALMGQLMGEEPTKWSLDELKKFELLDDDNNVTEAGVNTLEKFEEDFSKPFVFDSPETGAE